MSSNDYLLLKKSLEKRFSSHNPPWPDLLVIDGGKGHLRVAQNTLKAMGITLPVIAIAKGPHRRSGHETIYSPQGEPMAIPSHHNTFFFLQTLRDEVHRFGVSRYRRRHTKGTFTHQLEAIPGIGPHKKKSLLNHFGSLEAIKSASLKQLQQVPGISYKLAQTIFYFLNP